MLWSDPPDEPPEELHEVQAKLRRVGFVLATAIMVGTLVLLMR
ncbi:morphogenic membrane protein MmpB [Streptomyces sp. RGM 3693]